MATNPNDPAYPTDSVIPGYGQVEKFKTGLTKYEEFVKAAMQGLCHQELYYGTNEKPINPWPWIAEQSVMAADALIAELNKEAK